MSMDTRMQDRTEPSYAYGAGAPVVAQATAEERAAFITRTYLHLLLAVVAFTVLEVVWFSTPVAGAMIGLLTTGKFAWLLVLGAFIGVSYFANKWALSSTSLGMQYAGLGLFVVAESLLFMPLIAMA